MEPGVPKPVCLAVTPKLALAVPCPGWLGRRQSHVRPQSDRQVFHPAGSSSWYAFSGSLTSHTSAVSTGLPASARLSGSYASAGSPDSHASAGSSGYHTQPACTVPVPRPARQAPPGAVTPSPTLTSWRSRAPGSPALRTPATVITHTCLSSSGASAIIGLTWTYVNSVITSPIQRGKTIFSQPPIVQVLPLKKMREACNFHHRYTSTMTDF